MKKAPRKGAFPLLIKLANEKALRYYVFINIGNMSKKHHTKLDWKGALVWANLFGQFVTSQISRSAIGSIFLEKSYWMREEGRPCVSLISRQFSSGRPVLQFILTVNYSLF